jgi:hypothetical protein
MEVDKRVREYFTECLDQILSIEVYLYSNNNPIIYFDQAGLKEKSVYECWKKNCYRYRYCEKENWIFRLICKKYIDSACRKPGWPCCRIEYNCCIMHCTSCAPEGDISFGRVKSCNFLQLICIEETS